MYLFVESINLINNYHSSIESTALNSTQFIDEKDRL
jgi:hypothetical protein